MDNWDAIGNLLEAIDLIEEVEEQCKDAEYISKELVGIVEDLRLYIKFLEGN